MRRARVLTAIGAACAFEAAAAAQPAPTEAGNGNGSAGATSGSTAAPTAGSAAPTTPATPPTAPTSPAQPPTAAPAINAPPAAVTGIAGTVESPDLDAPLAGATITIVGTSVSTTTDDEGHYTLVVAPGRYRVRAEFAGFQTIERAVTVTLGPASLDFKLSTGAALNQTLVVVGAHTPRTNVDSTAPVDVITAEDIARSGEMETGKILNELEPSFISQSTTIADGTDHVDPAALRGLGPDQVLVLVNGKRRHTSALLNLNATFGRGTTGTDFNAIAPGSIKRIEILRDGASTQYGSDAIAGVINIVTKDSDDAAEIDSEAGITASRDGAELMSSANYGWRLGDRGFLNITGEFLQRQATNRAGTYTGPIFSQDGANDATILQQRGLTRDDFSMRIGQAAAQFAVGEYDMELPFSDTGKFYSFGDLSYRHGNAAGFYRLPNQTDEVVPQLYPNGFLPEIQSDISDSSITVGVKQKGTWTVDASLTRGRSSFRFNVENSDNASLGTSSPTSFNAGEVVSTETVGNVDLQRKLATDAVTSLNVVLGSEFRVENYQIVAGDEASYVDGGNGDIPGAQVFPGFQPVNEVNRTRESVGVYAGIESELTKQLALDIGGRYEAYSDFGQSPNGKIALRYKLTDWLGLRGGVSTGFRAPSLQQTWFSNVSTQFISIGGTETPQQVLTSNNQSPITKAFGIPDLKEERSINASGGFTIHANDNLSVTTDGYLINIYDRIVLTSLFSASDPTVASILSEFPGVNQAQFFANAVDTQTYGGDVVADYAIGAGSGTVTLTASANFTTTKVTDVHIPSSLETRFGGDTATLRGFYFDRLAQNQIENSVPHQKGYLAARYNLGPWGFLARANFVGAVYYRPDDPADDEDFSAKVLFDAAIHYQVAKAVHIAIGANNLLNTFPDPNTKAANIDFGQFIYNRNVMQFGENGGFYYVKLDLAFL